MHGKQLEETEEDFARTFREEEYIKPGKLFIYTRKPDMQDKGLIMFYHGRQKAGVNEVREYYNLTRVAGVDTVIIIWGTQKPSSFAQQAIKDLNQDNGRIWVEQFLESRLEFNVMEHELVPPHTKLTPEEKEKVLASYRLKENDLPKIQETDPVACYLGLRVGDVVKIVRKSESAGRHTTYRITIPCVKK